MIFFYAPSCDIDGDLQTLFVQGFTIKKFLLHRFGFLGNLGSGIDRSFSFGKYS